MRTLSNRAVAHLVGNTMNFIVCASLVLAFLVETSTPEIATLTIEEILAEDDQKEETYRFPDPATLSFVSIEPERPADVFELAKGIYFEARSEDRAGQIQVARAILARVNDPRWPNTIAEVIRQGEERRNRCQFSFMCDGKPEHITNKAAWSQALDIAVQVYREWKEGGDMGCAHSYRATYVTSKNALAWFATLKKDTQIGRHIFYCDKHA